MYTQLNHLSLTLSYTATLKMIQQISQQGRNISCDLHNEHLNKLFKDIVHNLGVNLTEATVTRAAWSVSTLYDIAYSFDKAALNQLVVSCPH